MFFVQSLIRIKTINRLYKLPCLVSLLFPNVKRVQTEQTRLIKDLLYGFVGLKFVVPFRKDQKTLSLLNVQPYLFGSFVGSR